LIYSIDHCQLKSWKEHLWRKRDYRWILQAYKVPWYCLGGRLDLWWGLGLLYWCYSGDVLQSGALVFCTGSNVPNPVPIMGLFSSSPSSNQTSFLRRVQQKPSIWKKKNFSQQYVFLHFHSKQNSQLTRNFV